MIACKHIPPNMTALLITGMIATAIITAPVILSVMVFPMVVTRHIVVTAQRTGGQRLHPPV